MPTSASTLKLFRQVHLYLGVFLAPALLFFAITGGMQTFSLHETTQGSSYKPPRWIATLAQLHKKQTTTVPVRKPRPNLDPSPNAASSPSPDGKPHGNRHDRGGDPASQPPAQVAASTAVPVTPPTPQPPPKRHLPMKIFFLLVAIGLFLSTATGIYMAYKYDRNKLLITGLLIAGVVVPLLLLPF